MTADDEAFIRCIVDRPGDDLPRLAYADWLDDHSDPRGDYIRAEQFARNRAESRGFTPGWYLAFTELAAALDPVWVARVTRAPFGVCCDRRRFTGARAVSRAAVDRVAELARVPLAPAHVAFLLNYNGGQPAPAAFAVHDGNARRVFDLDWFYDIRYPDGVPPGVSLGTHLAPRTPIEYFLRFPPPPDPDPPPGAAPQPRGMLDRLRRWLRPPPAPDAPPPVRRGAMPLAMGPSGCVVVHPNGACHMMYAGEDDVDFTLIGTQSLGVLLAHDPSRDAA